MTWSSLSQRIRLRRLTANQSREQLDTMAGNPGDGDPGRQAAIPSGNQVNAAGDGNVGNNRVNLVGRRSRSCEPSTSLVSSPTSVSPIRAQVPLPTGASTSGCAGNHLEEKSSQPIAQARGTTGNQPLPGN